MFGFPEVFCFFLGVSGLFRKLCILNLSVGSFVLSKVVFVCLFLGGGFNFFYFHPEKLLKISNLTSIFFRWVGSTTKQF